MVRTGRRGRVSKPRLGSTCPYARVCIYSLCVELEFEWDARKAASNVRKHGVDFADAAGVLYDELAVTIPDERADEDRFVTIGLDALGRLLVVVYTWRGDRARLISARRATRRERRQYEE
jgi:uncharacterized DUF497 family protein